jgi:hypothetical protein
VIAWFRLLRWQQWEGQLATLIWIASLALAHWYPNTYWVVLATTVNLLHSRYSSYFAGTTLQSRVMDFLNDSLTVQQNRLTAMEKSVDDIKESQMKIAGAWRGRNLP